MKLNVFRGGIICLLLPSPPVVFGVHMTHGINFSNWCRLCDDGESSDLALRKIRTRFLNSRLKRLFGVLGFESAGLV